MEMEAKKRGGDHHLHAVWFAAGTAVAVACLQRAAVVSLVEQWRMWVFLALNLLLLAILFTSTCTPPSASAGGQEGNTNNAASEERKVNERKKRRKQRKIGVVATATDHEGGADQLKFAKKTSRNRGEEKREVVVIEEDDDGAKPKAMSLSLSQEELNERVEAFIAMFRRQLISDAKAKNESPASAQPILGVGKT